MNGKSCFFIGHREADERLFPRLELEIKRLITEENVRFFYVGGYGGFERIAAAAVKHAKQKYPDITLMLVCRIIPLNTPQRLPLALMGHITTCDWLVCYVRHGVSNSKNLLEYAGRREKKSLLRIINIGEHEESK